MAIKVKHEMNAAPAAAAGLASGRAKRSMDTARMFASGGGSRGGGGAQGATAHVISPGGASAHVVGAHAPGVTDWTGMRKENEAQARERKILAQMNNDAVMDRQVAADDAAMERDAAQHDFQMERDAAQHGFQTERDAAQHGYARELAESKSLLDIERAAKLEQLKLPPMPSKQPQAPVKSGFPTSPEYDRLRNVLLGNAGDTDAGNKLGDLLSGAFSVVRDALAKAKARFGMPSDAAPSSGIPDKAYDYNVYDKMKNLLLGGTGEPGVKDAPPSGAARDDIANVYAGGGTVFGQGSATGGPLDYLRPSGGDGVFGAESEEYASSIGGMIGAFLRMA
ncbi:MAG: hypothetical protein II649_08190 [Kiritimatiellae bacterium]|nr:hypothetical protein [Kiritimatiellia bacterium]